MAYLGPLTRLGHPTRIVWIRFTAIALGLIVCFAWADRALYDFLHLHFNQHTRPIPRLLTMPTRLLRSAEDWGENIFICAVLFAMWRLDPRRRSRTICLVAAACLATLSVEVIKRSTGRDRPEVSDGKLVFRGPTRVNDFLGDAHSFPSGHVASAAAYSGSLAVYYPPLRPVCVVMVAACGGSRIWKERHFLSDCLVGALLGWWFGTALPRARLMQPLLRWFDRRFSYRRASQIRVRSAA